MRRSLCWVLARTARPTSLPTLPNCSAKLSVCQRPAARLWCCAGGLLIALQHQVGDDLDDGGPGGGVVNRSCSVALRRSEVDHLDEVAGVVLGRVQVGIDPATRCSSRLRPFSWACWRCGRRGPGAVSTALSSSAGCNKRTRPATQRGQKPWPPPRPLPPRWAPPTPQTPARTSPDRLNWPRWSPSRQDGPAAPE
jgi:hypothetical protein